MRYLTKWRPATVRDLPDIGNGAPAAYCEVSRGGEPEVLVVWQGRNGLASYRAFFSSNLSTAFAIKRHAKDDFTEERTQFWQQQMRQSLYATHAEEFSVWHRRLTRVKMRGYR